MTKHNIDYEKIQEELNDLRKDNNYIQQRDKAIQKVIQQKGIFRKVIDPEKLEKENKNDKMRLSFFEKIAFKKLIKKMENVLRKLEKQDETTELREKAITGIIELTEIFIIEVDINSKATPVTEKILREMQTQELLSIFKDSVEMLKEVA